MTTNNELDKYKRALEAGVPLEQLRKSLSESDDSYDALKNQLLYGNKTVKSELNWDSDCMVVPIPGASVTLPNRVWVTPPHAGGSIPTPMYRSPPTMPEWVEQLREVNRKNFELTMEKDQLLQLVADAYEIILREHDDPLGEYGERIERAKQMKAWLSRIDKEGT